MYYNRKTKLLCDIHMEKQNKSKKLYSCFEITGLDNNPCCAKCSNISTHIILPPM